LVITGYFDDSGTHSDSSLVVWGGLLGTEKRWTEFDVAWRALLREPLPEKRPLKRFHLYDCKNGTREFQDYSRAERDRVTHLFRRVIIEANLFHVSMSICKEPWDELIVGNYRVRLGDAESAAFSACIGQARDIVKQAALVDGQLKLVFDKGRHGPTLAELSQRIVDFKRQPPEIVEIGFDDVTSSSALQAADVIATESYWALQEFMKHGDSYRPRAHFLDLLSKTANVGKWLDRAGIEAEVAKLKAEGMSP
jgi:hypothetical protein